MPFVVESVTPCRATLHMFFPLETGISPIVAGRPLLRKCATLALISWAVLGSVSCVSRLHEERQANREGGPQIRVTLDVFSGRPNPSWELTAEEHQELAKRLVGLPATDRAPVAQGLGYRGFLISNPERQSGVPAEVRVYRGFVTSKEGKDVSERVDVHGLESWLIEQARKRGFGDLIDEEG